MYCSILLKESEDVGGSRKIRGLYKLLCKNHIWLQILTMKSMIKFCEFKFEQVSIRKIYLLNVGFMHIYGSVYLSLCSVVEYCFNQAKISYICLCCILLL